MNILFLTNVLPFRRRNGGEVCSARLIARLCEVADHLRVVGRGDIAGAPSIPCLEVRSLARPAIEFAKMSRLQKLVSLAGAVAGGESWTAYRMGKGVMQSLRSAAGDGPFDCVFVDHVQVYKWYRALGLRVPAVLVAHNVEHQVYGDLLGRSTHIAARWVLGREQRLLSELDHAVLRDIGVIACLTAADRAYYTDLAARLGMHASVEVLPSYFEGVASEPEGGAPRPDHLKRIGLLGTWTWESNRLGIEWFLREVLPHIDGRCEIVIGGRGLRADQLPARVRYLGFVESAEGFYRECDVIAIPSTAGGGVQEKTIEAIGHGVPVVATPIAVRGIEPCPSHVEVVSTPREFAEACGRQQELDAETVRAEAVVWNGERRAQYAGAIKMLMRAALQRGPGRESRGLRAD